MEQDAVVYGSLYLDEGESWVVAKRQIKLCRNPRVKAFFFDVIGYEENREQAQPLMQQMKEYLKKIRPDITEIHIGFSVNSEIKDMPRS